MNKKEAGHEIYMAIKKHIEAQGGALWVEKFPKNFPISLRTINAMKEGKFTLTTVQKIPFLRVHVQYTVEEIKFKNERI